MDISTDIIDIVTGGMHDDKDGVTNAAGLGDAEAI